MALNIIDNNALAPSTSTPPTTPLVQTQTTLTQQPTITTPTTPTTPIVQTAAPAQTVQSDTQKFLDWAKANLTTQGSNVATQLANEDASKQTEAEARRLAKLEQQKVDNETKKTNALTGPNTGTDITTDTTGVTGSGYWTYKNGVKRWVSTDGTNSGSTIQDENDQALAEFQDMTNRMRNGTIPLNPLQQAQLDSMRTQFEALIDAQKEANKQYEGSIQQAGITGGRSRYAPEIMAGEVLNSVNVGIKKVAEIDAKMTSALAEMEAGFQEQNYKLIQESYKAFTDAQKLKQDNLDEINKGIAEALKATNEANAKAKAELDKTRSELLIKAGENDAPSSVIEGIKNASDVASMVNLARGYLQGTTGIVGEYNFYKRQAEAAGQTPLDFNSYQTMDANRKAKANAAANGSGYNPSTLTKITQLAGQFDNNQTVKAYQTVAEGKAFLDSIPNDTQNPADQQGVIYAFAKIMDPNSVVREGEYNTVQKYAQSWASTFGFKADRIFSNSPFLTPEAIANMKATIDSKVTAAENSYKNIYNEYARKINKVSGGTDGQDFLTDYTGGYAKTGSDIINKEAQAEQTVKGYLTRFPDKRDSLDKNIDIVEQTLGRPATYQDLLEAFPEYSQ